MVEVIHENTWKLWAFIVGKAFNIEFERPSMNEHYMFLKEISEREIGLYIHFPFCRSFCKYCPYYREFWSEKAFNKYSKALIKEIKLFGKILNDLDLVVVDAHVGGGTPSLPSPQFWNDIIEELKSAFNWKTDLGIEANPEDLVDESKVFALRDAGISEVSIGVQSFHRSLLRELGRRHGPEDSIAAIENVKNANYKLVNVDLMFMIPGEDLRTWEEDLRITAELNPTQITTYPTLLTPQAIAWNNAVKGRIKQPVRLFEKFAKLPWKILREYGYNMVRIESWSKGGDYSTVNLEMTGPLLALGAGAFGFTGTYEWCNVHSVREYVRALLNDRLPVAVARKVSKAERASRIVADQLFCRGSMNIDFMREKIGFGFEILPRQFKWWLKIMEVLGLIENKGKILKLTNRGIMVAHKFVWTFVMKVPCRLAYKLMETPWPMKISLP